MIVSFNSQVKSGLPIICEAEICPAEPDVGILYRYANIEDILWPNGKPVTDKVYSSIPEDDFERLREEALEAAHDQ